MKRLQGWLVWALGLGLAMGLPGELRKSAPPPAFPWNGVGPALIAVLSLGLLAPLAAAWLGPSVNRRRGLALLEAPPEFLWGGLVLALWPAAWGPAGAPGWGVAFLLAALPGEVRWLGQALPMETPFPAAWGRSATLRARRRALVHLVPDWLSARLPLWVAGALILERIFGVAGLGSDWTARIASRDRLGLAAWVLGFAALWSWTRRKQAGP